MKEFIDYLERKIEGCDSLGGMEREKAIYQSVLKDYRKQFAISDVVGQSEQLLAFAQYLHNHSYVNKGFKPETLVRRFKGE